MVVIKTPNSYGLGTAIIYNIVIQHRTKLTTLKINTNLQLNALILTPPPFVMILIKKASPRV